MTDTTIPDENKNATKNVNKIRWADLPFENIFESLLQKQRNMLEWVEDESFRASIQQNIEIMERGYEPNARTGLTFQDAVNNKKFMEHVEVADSADFDGTGIVVTSNLNYHYIIKDSNVWEEYPNIPGFSPLSTFGLADTMQSAKEHVLAEYERHLKMLEKGEGWHEPEDLVIPEDMFFVLIVNPIFRSNEENGFRPHKWGEYIGDRLEGYEYLSDENVKSVYHFSLVPVRRIADSVEPIFMGKPSAKNNKPV